jgi:hypothetical protein
MDGKILIGTRNTFYYFTGDTRIIYLSGLTENINVNEIEKIFLIYNETQKIVYYSPLPSLSHIKITNLNEITINSSLPVLQSNDRLKILIWCTDPQSTLNFINQYEPINYTNINNNIINRDILTISNYNNIFLSLLSTCGSGNTIRVIFQIPLTSTCVNTNDINWKDITQDLTGMSDIIINQNTTISLYWVWNSFPIDRIMIKTVYTVISTVSNSLIMSLKLT